MKLFQKKQVVPMQIALSLGTFFALVMLCISLAHLALGRYDITIQLLQEWYVGFDVSFMGILLGMFYGFLDGFIGGYVFTVILNYFTKK